MSGNARRGAVEWEKAGLYFLVGTIDIGDKGSNVNENAALLNRGTI